MNKTKVEFNINESRFSSYLLDSIVHLLVFDKEFLGRCSVLFKPSVFEGERRVVAELCYDYFAKYSSAPCEYVVDLVESYLSKKPQQRPLLLKYLERIADMDVNKNYVFESFGGFVRDKMCSDAIVRAEQLVRQGRYVEAREDIIRTFKDAELINGDSVFDFLDPANVDNILERENRGKLLKTFIDPYDKVVGGVGKPEMILVFGEKNVGKSFLMAHLGTVFALQGENVLEIHLETPLDEMKLRHAAAFTGMRTKFRGDNEDHDGSAKAAVKARLKKKIGFISRRGGSLWLYEDTAFTMSKLEALVDNIEFTKGKSPTVVLLDSPKQMIAESRYRDYLRDQEYLYRRLLDFSKARQVALVVTGWAQRKSGRYGDFHVTRGQQVAGSIEQVNIVDTVWTLSQNEEESARGIVWMFVPYSRFYKKFLTIEIEQNLDIGQFVINAREVPAGSRAAEEARRLGLKYEESRKSVSGGGGV